MAIAGKDRHPNDRKQSRAMTTPSQPAKTGAALVNNYKPLGIVAITAAARYCTSGKPAKKA